MAQAFEHAPALVERLAPHAPFASVERVIDRAERELAAMDDAQRALVLAAHPRIGAPAAALSEASRREQGDEGGAAVLAELARLQDDYERRFGFRFVVFVDGRARSAIVPVLRERLEHDRASELARGTSELLAIARSRLERA